MIKQFVAGEEGGPEPGQTKFVSEFLKNVLVDYIIVNKSNEQQIGTNPDFMHSYIEGSITRPNNAWVLADTLIIHYRQYKSNCSN